MNIQVVNLNSSDTLQYYVTRYGLRDLKAPSELFGIEIRNLPENLTGNLPAEFRLYRKKSADSSSFFVTGTLSSLNEQLTLLSSYNQDLSAGMLMSLNKFSGYNNIKYRIGTKEFIFDKLYVMGILNVTPDSFSDGGEYLDTDRGIAHALYMIDEGTDVIDVGGESTRPGSLPVSEKEEIKRIIPVIKGILKQRPDAVISVDTTKSTVAREALNAGAVMINDISGLTFDEKLAESAASANAALVVMHIKGTPEDMQKNPSYENVTCEVYDYLAVQTETAKKYGINNIFIDPGIGFGKRMEDNFELINRLQDFKSLGFPILLGVSRKSFLGKYLNLDINNRDAASALCASIAAIKGARLIRTHNVKNGLILRDLFNRLN